MEEWQRLALPSCLPDCSCGVCRLSILTVCTHVYLQVMTIMRAAHGVLLLLLAA